MRQVGLCKFGWARIVVVLFGGIGLALGLAGRVAARVPQDKWEVPAAAKRVKNPYPATPAAIAAAKVVYKNNCDGCHGDTGRGDGVEAMMYDPPPDDLTDARVMNAQTDGELYYKITQGRRPMPGFAKPLSDQQRWQLVDLLRTFVPRSRPVAAGKSAAKTHGKH